MSSIDSPDPAGPAGADVGDDLDVPQDPVLGDDPSEEPPPTER